MTGVTQVTDGADETNLAETVRPQLMVTLSIDSCGEEPELAVAYVDRSSLNPGLQDPDYWSKVVDLR